MPKQFAFFLPQFHSIPENDEWWGKGFTEWTNVKKGKPLFEGHLQPNLPLNDNYYDLLEKKTMKWQTDLMKKYHVDGLIYYHYYFNGKKLLEKPAENLLKWREIDQPFFFCWANHSWYRSWDGSKKMLVEQVYGNEEDWEKHFQYLLPFFQDSRYEKRNNKPLLMIFKVNFPEKEKMFKYIDMRCKQYGFDGLCLIETWWYNRWKNNFDKALNKAASITEFMFAREPAFAESFLLMNKSYGIGYFKRAIKRKLIDRIFTKVIRKRKPLIFNGNKLYIEKIKNEIKSHKLIHGTFFGWDNTPRHGNRGYVITPPDKEVYMEYMNSVKDEEYIFINAWNEWAEGMVLEPTKYNKYKYLEWISEWVKKQS